MLILRTGTGVLCGCAAAVLAVLLQASTPAQQGARLFAPGVISTEAPEFATAFSPDGRFVYFNRAAADRSSFPIYVSERRGDSWTVPAPAPFAATGRKPDPFVALDGTRIFFCSSRVQPDGELASDLDVWYVERQGKGWSDPVNLGAPVNTDNMEVFISATRDGTLYFASDRSCNGDIYRAARRGSGYDVPERLPATINTAEGESNPAISPDERYLFFAATRPDGLGGSDLYVSERRNGIWTQARNVGPLVNSPSAEFAPHVSPDATRLYFTSERPGIVAAPRTGRPPGDIYWIELSAVVGGV